LDNKTLAYRRFLRLSAYRAFRDLSGGFGDQTLYYPDF
jgi:hypothetical protein